MYDEGDVKGGLSHSHEGGHICYNKEIDIEDI